MSNLAPRCDSLLDEIEVSILRPSGAMAKVTIWTDQLLIALCEKVAKLFDTPLPAVKLLMDDGTVLPPEAALKPIGSLGISNGTVLTFVSLPLLEAKLGAKIKIEGAGTDGCNGIYVAENCRSRGGMTAGVCFKKTCGAHVIRWWRSPTYSVGSWPAGWYLERSKNDCTAHYFIMSNDMNCLPCNGWAPYDAPYHSIPGHEPMPIIVPFASEVPKNAATQKSMTKSALVKTLARQSGVPPNKCRGILRTFANLVASEVTKTGTFTIPHLCSIKACLKPARAGGTKIAFGREMQVKARPAKKAIKVIPSTTIRKHIRDQADSSSCA